MPYTGVVQAPIPIPDPNLLHPERGQRASQPTFFLRSTPPIFIGLIVGGNNSNQAAMRGFVLPPRPAPTLPHFVLVRAGGKIEASALVHTRALGAPAVSSRFSVTGLVHARTLGAPTASTPVIPPVEPPPTPTPTPAVVSPRNLRYVRRRNKPPER